MLGEGIYASRSLIKAQNYGKVVFRLLVFTGKVKKINFQNHSFQKSWQERFDSAWVPPNCGMVWSGLTVFMNSF